MLAPSLIVLEFANAALRAVRSQAVEAVEGASSLRDLAALPIELVPIESLGDVAFRVALALGLSVYDAAYVAVAEARDAVLVTADRRLAAAYDRAELIV